MYSLAQPRPTLCDHMDYSSLGSSLYGIFMQEYWSELPFPTPWDLSHPAVKLMSPASPALEGGFFTTVPSRKPLELIMKASEVKVKATQSSPSL